MGDRWAEQSQALLSPWPPGRRNRVILAIVLPTLAVVGSVVLAWEASIKLIRKKETYLIYHDYHAACRDLMYFF